MISQKTEPSILIKPFQWSDWKGLWMVRNHQLAEEGIVGDDTIPDGPDLSSPYEKDFHRIDQVYLTGRGNFWIAWMADDAVGYVGAQDYGEFIELRHMYVQNEFRRQGIGSMLVQVLIDHCAANRVRAIELWTAHDGPGRPLYEKLGFRISEAKGDEPEYEIRGNREIRMRRGLT